MGGEERIIVAGRRLIVTRLPGAVAVGVAVAVAVYALSFWSAPSVRGRLAVEDGIIETTTALVFLGAAIIGTLGMLRSPHRGIHWLVPVVGLLGFADEIRFGARIWGVTLPTVSGVEIDNFHAVLLVADRRMGSLGLTHPRMAVAAGIAALGVIAVLIRTKRLRRVLPWLTAHPPMALMLGALGLLAAGFGFDQLGSRPTLLFLEETCEFAASGLVAVAAACLLEETPAAAIVPTSRSSSPADGRRRSPRPRR
jgi:hypothetical protein